MNFRFIAVLVFGTLLGRTALAQTAPTDTARLRLDQQQQRYDAQRQTAAQSDQDRKAASTSVADTKDQLREQKRQLKAQQSANRETSRQLKAQKRAAKEAKARERAERQRLKAEKKALREAKQAQ